MKFEELNLVPELFQAIRDQNIETCTDIQEKAIPIVLDAKDLSGLSQTGTGKTFAFLVPLIDRIVRSKKAEAVPAELQVRIYPEWKPSHFVLVLAPTRELVDQIYNVAKKLCDPCGLKCAAIIGGVDHEPQKKALQEGVDIIIGTPGRLLDFYNSHVVHFKHIRAIVFDEADRMFDMGFKDDMVYILQRCPQERQILLFSATLNFDVLNTAYRFNSHPVELNVSRDQAKAVDVEDEIYHVGDDQKPQYLLSLLKRDKPKQTIIFSNFKNQVDRISSFLSNNGLPAVGISSLLTQAQRDRVITQFKNENETNILVATDLAARGLDIKGVDLVINVELPDDAENYVHRIGRTGRAGAKGKAYSLVCDKDVQALSRIEDYLKGKLKVGWLEDQDLVQEFKPVVADDYRGSSRIRRTGLAAAKDKPPFEQSLRKPRHFEKRHGRPDQRPHHRSENRPEHRSDNRPDNRQGNRPNGQHPQGQPSHGQQPRDNNIHRDRRMKRHDEGKPPQGARHQQQQGNRRPPHDPKNRNQFKGNNSKHRHSKNFQKRPETPAKSVPILEKVSSFFKKLFD